MTFEYEDVWASDPVYVFWRRRKSLAVAKEMNMVK
jgi:hypothetical protein